MAGKSPFDKYNDTSTRVSSSISTGYSSQTAVQPKYSHSPTSPPNYETTKPRLVWSNDNPRPNAKTNPATRIPLALRLTGLGLGMFVGSKIYETFSNNPEALEESIIFGKGYKEPTPEEMADSLTKEIQKYNPDFTFPHKKDAKGVQYLADQLHYEKVRYYNLHKHSCRSGYDLNLYTKTVRDLDARVNIINVLNGLPGNDTDINNDLQEDINKKAYEDYKANGGKLSYNDWLTTVWSKTAGNDASDKNTPTQQAKETSSRADQPLEPVHPNKAQHGHGHAEHGYQTTELQQKRRIVSGIKPSGHPGAPTSKASKFLTPEAETEALNLGREQLELEIKDQNIPTIVNGEPNRHAVTVETNRSGGFGERWIRAKDSNGQNLRDINGNFIPQKDPVQLNRSKLIYEYVPSTNKWEPVTYFPVE